MSIYPFGVSKTYSVVYSPARESKNVEKAIQYLLNKSIPLTKVNDCIEQEAKYHVKQIQHSKKTSNELLALIIIEGPKELGNLLIQADKYRKSKRKIDIGRTSNAQKVLNELKLFDENSVVDKVKLKQALSDAKKRTRKYGKRLDGVGRLKLAIYKRLEQIYKT